MQQLIGIALAFMLTLSVIPVPAGAFYGNPDSPLDHPHGVEGNAAVPPSVSTNPSSARPGQGGTPPGQAKQAEPVPDDVEDAIGLGAPENILDSHVP